MRVHVLQHASFEGLGCIASWLNSRAAEVSISHLYAGDALPDPPTADWVIVMGGPMSVNDEARFPWLREEKRFVRGAIDAGKKVLGVCLGAQVIAASLGAKVYANAEREVGWHPITSTPEARSSPFGPAFPAVFEAFHWHGETFQLPDGATRLARSEACDTQAFSHGAGVLGLQFHLETTLEGATALCDECPDDLRPGRWIQGRDLILGDPGRFIALHREMHRVLEHLAAVSS
jgi:GMP synthase-like glutamine amidotransferase